jgi:adenylate cyclase
LLAALLVNYATEGRQRRFIKQAFNQYLHPVVIDQLLEHPERLCLGGERREITIFFSDLQGFSGLAERLEPEALTSLLNDYLTAMTDIILDSGGTVDKYVGDAIVAFWNAPLDQPDHALRAVRAAQLCQERLAELRPQLCARAGGELHMRIGINTGVAVVGNMGSQRRFDYTVLGDAVNLASRLEGVNKEFGSLVLLAGSTREQLDGSVRLREIGCVGVVGRDEPVRIFEPLSAAAATSDQAAFAAALARYSAGEFTAAAREFACLADNDAVARRYAQRCRELATAPPEGWDGVWRLSSK